MKKSMIFLGMLLSVNLSFSQCATTISIYSFTYNGHIYEIVKENKTWADANACALSRGGYLLEVNDAAEQQAVFNALKNDAAINNNNTIAPDGGGASYVWIGGNDSGLEGRWIWSVDDSPFWLGNKNGNAVAGRYTHWGSVNTREPDNYLNKQDGLGMCLIDWPNGKAGEWNDIDEINTLYYVIERNATVGIDEIDKEHTVKIYPNPSADFITIEGLDKQQIIRSINVVDALGRSVLEKEVDENVIRLDLGSLKAGLYWIVIHSDGNQPAVKRFVKSL